MADLPGSILLIASHFSPLPRSSIIKASSSGVHFVCLRAGELDGFGPSGRFNEGDGMGGGGSTSSFCSSEDMGQRRDSMEARI